MRAILAAVSSGRTKFLVICLSSSNGITASNRHGEQRRSPDQHTLPGFEISLE
jgi:hypothetical protein